MIDAAPIVVIGTGFVEPSSNEKTGPMIQTWILRQDVHPQEAIKRDLDYSICGDCPSRGIGAGRERACYVQIGFAPSGVWKAYQRGLYQPLGDLRFLQAHPLRLGAYGDPAAVPVDLVLSWASAAAGDSGRPRHTGYTHQWRICDPRLRDVLMASVDSDLEFHEASDAGWRCFRVRGSADLSELPREVTCPASAERGHLVQCASCLACNGAGSGRRGHIGIRVHGAQHLIRAFDARNFPIPVRIAA